MKIHYSARFKDKEISYHGDFLLNASAKRILEEKNTVVRFAISDIKGKCENYFKVDFKTMTFFEVYFFDKNSGDEISLFAKTKTETETKN